MFWAESGQNACSCQSLTSFIDGKKQNFIVVDSWDFVYFFCLRAEKIIAYLAQWRVE
ncbi:MAG: hypothetical protein MUD08_09435 [Cytophagales bacterium]|nr:hypothetical protein [Cytophagales bacterium]